MKLTRSRLKRLIIESILEAKRYIGSPGGGVVPADLAYQRAKEKDELAGEIDPGIKNLLKHENPYNRKSGRELAYTLAPEGSPLEQAGMLTPEEETAYDYMGHDRATEESLPEAGVEQLVDKDALWGAMKSKSDNILSRFGFRYVDDIDFDFPQHGDKFLDPHAREEREEFLGQFRFQANALGCDIEDLTFVDTEDPEANKTLMAIYDIMRERGATEISIPGDVGNYGQNSLYDVDGLKVLLTGHWGGYYTATICG